MMDIDVPPGKYVLAVSGGVDSMVLLDLLSKDPQLELIVAHFDHGIRPDSYKDQEFAAAAAKKYGLQYETKKVALGEKASEEEARRVRYEFLQNVKEKYGADAIITAHHQDDLIETAIINILRGTGPKGLIAITQNPAVHRPLIDIPKKEILSYAKANNIHWREDPTNRSPDYLRNYVRRNLVPKLDPKQRQELIENIRLVANLDKEISLLIRTISEHMQTDKKIDRQLFVELPNDAASELVAFWLRQVGFRQFDKKTIERTVILIKTAQPHTRHDISKGLTLVVDKHTARFDIAA